MNIQGLHRTHAHSPAAEATPHNTPGGMADIRVLPRLSGTEVGSIVTENMACVSPKHVPLVTSELITCRAVAIFTGSANYLAHLFESPREAKAHTATSMLQMLKTAAQGLGIREQDLQHCKVAVVCGSEACDDVDFPLRSALRELNVTADWYEGRHARGGVYAAVHQDQVCLGRDDMEETARPTPGVRSAAI
ncbi:hypothetical protein ACW9H6_14350 [Pseudomonas sp. SDO528_S397]